MKRINQVWSVSLMVIGLTTLVVAGSRILGITLPDAAVVAAGVLDLIALPVLSFTTVRKLIGEKKP